MDKPPPVRSVAAATVAPSSADVVAARDKAILAALKLRPWKTAALVSVLPTEAGQSAEQRMTGLTSALIRLRVKKLIVDVGGEWRPA